jgi:lipopolysaccharide cholinephosphotransferase
MSENLKKEQNILLNLISFIDKVSTKNDLWYSLACGSVLGAIRHKGFIPWDADIDIYVSLKQLEEFRKSILDELPDNMTYYAWEKSMKYHPVFDRLSLKGIDSQNLHVDIFPLIGVPNDEGKRKKFIKKCYVSYRVFRSKHVDVKTSKDNHRTYMRILKCLTTLIPDRLIKHIEYGIENKYDLDQSNYCYYYSSGYAEKGCMLKELVMISKRVPFEGLVLPVPADYQTYLTQLYGDYMVEKRSGFKVIDKIIK